MPLARQLDCQKGSECFSKTMQRLILVSCSMELEIAKWSYIVF